jgi:hypothetical protein
LCCCEEVKEEEEEEEGEWNGCCIVGMVGSFRE